MTLPYGFGSHDTPPTEKPSKCRLGKTCSSEYGAGKCAIHYWIYRNHEAWSGIKIISLFILCVTVFAWGMFAFDDYLYSLGEPARNVIDGYNCKDLAEYVADKKPEYDYAEHRYEWLCVNEQVKEFQG